MYEGLWSPLLSFGVIQGLLLAVALAVKPTGRRLSNWLIAATILGMTSVVAYWFLVATGRFHWIPPVVYFGRIAGPAVAPLFYYYTKSLLDPDYRPRVTGFLAAVFLPGILRIAQLTVDGIRPGNAVQTAENLNREASVGAPLGDVIYLVALAAFMLVYFILAWSHIRYASRELRDEGAARSQVTWLTVLGGALLAYGALVAVITVAVAVVGRIPTTYGYILALCRCFLIQIVGLAALFVPAAFSSASPEVASRRARLDQDLASSYRARLEELMQTRKPFKKEDLRVADLADMLDVPAHFLSQLMNETMGVNFADFVNGYRVEEAKKQLLDHKNHQYTLVAIALEAGFNSRASFNRVFKRFEGVTPSEFRRRNGAQPLDTA